MNRNPVASQRGFTLIEAVIAMSLITVVGVTLLLVINATARSAVRAEESVTLLQHIRAQVETIQQSPFRADPADYPAIASVPEGFTVTWTSTDPGTSYTYPQPNGTVLTGVVQEITVTGTGDFSQMTLTFYKVRVP